MPPVEITNHSRRTLDFIVSGKPRNGVPPTDHVEPGETKVIDLADPGSAQLYGYVHAGLVSATPTRAKA